MNRTKSRAFIACSCLLLAGCGTTSETNVKVGNLSFNIPSTFQSVSSQSLDKAQIAHSILAAWRTTNESLILSESTLPSTISIQEFADSASKRMGQEMVGYSDAALSKASFSCNGKTYAGYLHTFTQKDIKDPNKINLYYTQFYFTQNSSVYILSLAQKEEKSIMNDIINSLSCIQK